MRGKDSIGEISAVLSFATLICDIFSPDSMLRYVWVNILTRGGDV
jgi:hypothetical protein